jgi:hypothetical protein
MRAGGRLNARLHSFQAFIAELQRNLIFALAVEGSMAAVAGRIVGILELFLSMNFGMNAKRHKNSNGMDERAPLQLYIDF